MQPRMQSTAVIIPEAMQAILSLRSATEKGGVSKETLGLAGAWGTR